MSPSRRAALASLPAAALLAAFVAATSAPAGADEPVRVELTCDVAFAAKSAGGFTDRLIWAADVADGAFTMTSADGPALAGTYRARGTKLRCTLDAASLDGLAAWAIQETPGLTAVVVKKQKVTITLGATRASRRIAAKLKLRATGAGGTKPSTLTISGDASARRVLVLNDAASSSEGSGPQVVGALRAAGHLVTEGGLYQDWDGSGLSGVETVVLLQGHEFADVMDEDADAALAAFVDAGGGLVRTELSASVVADLPYLAIDALLPVRSPNGETADSTAWQVVAPNHPLAKGLPKGFLVRDAGYAVVFPNPGADVVAENPFAIPMLTASSAGAGRVVHVNHDLTFTAPAIQDEILKVLVNAVEYTAP